jgi:hypothetical protein
MLPGRRSGLLTVCARPAGRPGVQPGERPAKRGLVIGLVAVRQPAGDGVRTCALLGFRAPARVSDPPGFGGWCKAPACLGSGPVRLCPGPIKDRTPRRRSRWPGRPAAALDAAGSAATTEAADVPPAGKPDVAAPRPAPRCRKGPGPGCRSPGAGYRRCVPATATSRREGNGSPWPEFKRRKRGCSGVRSAPAPGHRAANRPSTGRLPVSSGFAREAFRGSPHPAP